MRRRSDRWRCRRCFSNTTVPVPPSVWLPPAKYNRAPLPNVAVPLSVKPMIPARALDAVRSIGPLTVTPINVPPLLVIVNELFAVDSFRVPPSSWSGIPDSNVAPDNVPLPFKTIVPLP